MESFGENREKRREEKRVAVYITGSVRGCPSINRGATPVINRSDDRVCLVQDPVESSRRLRPPVPLRGYLSGGTGPAITTTERKRTVWSCHTPPSRGCFASYVCTCTIILAIVVIVGPRAVA